MEHHLLEVPGASQAFVFQRDLEGLEETAYPTQYKAAISDIDKSDAQEMLKQLKRKLDRQSGQTVNQYKPPIAGFSLDLDHVFSEAKSILQKWDKSKEQLDSLRQATLRIEAAKHFCLEPGSSLHKTLEGLEQVTCPAAMERTKSDQMSQLRAPRKPVVLLMGNDGAGKTSTLAAMAQKLSEKRYLQNLHGSMLATDESVEVPEVQIYFKMTGRHTFSAALHYLNVELAAQLHGKIGLQNKRVWASVYHYSAFCFRKMEFWCRAAFERIRR